MDDFEFRPITEGLGFRKKSSEAPEGAPEDSTIAAKVQGRIIDDIKAKKKSSFPMSNLDFTNSNPAPTKPNVFEKPKAFQLTPDVASPISNKMDPEIRSFIEQAQRLKPVSVIFAAIIFDSLVIIGLTCLFVVAVLLLAEVDLLAVLQAIPHDGMIQASIAVLMISIIALYVISFRSLCGWTLGEWAFDGQLGTEAEQQQMSYPLKVALRMFLVALTGFITLPILSLLMGRDLVGDTVGVSLYRK